MKAVRWSWEKCNFEHFFSLPESEKLRLNQNSQKLFPFDVWKGIIKSFRSEKSIFVWQRRIFSFSRSADHQSVAVHEVLLYTNE